jgi:hypothetical protein
MDGMQILESTGVYSEQELQAIKELPEEHKGRIFTALATHFSKYNDLLRKDSSIPDKDDL